MGSESRPAGFRFVHTADWQMGMKAAALGPAAERVRKARLEAGERVVQVAAEHGAECIVIAGDLFEDNGVEALLVQRVVDILREAPCPVFILPGNHDPLVAGSVYDREIWRRHEGRITIFRRPEPFVLRDGVTLLPCPYRDRSTRADLTEWIPPRVDTDAGIRVGVAHGSLRDVIAVEDTSACPIDAQRGSERGLNYLALGHWHSTFIHKDMSGAASIAYAGTHETTRFGERDSGNVLLVDISSAAAPPSLQSVRTGGLRWLQEDSRLDGLDSLQALVSRFDRQETADAAATLLELRLEGVVPAELFERITQDLEPLLAARFFFARLMNDLVVEPTADEVRSIAAAGPVRAACDRLLQRAEQATSDDERRIARRALLELYALAREVAG